MEEKKDKEYTEDKNSSKEIVELVIARLETMPANVNLSIGDEGSFIYGIFFIFFLLHFQLV